MGDLSQFTIGTYSWGEPYIMCLECCWTGELPGNLQETVDYAEGHRCQQTVDGQLAPREIGAGS